MSKIRGTCKLCSRNPVESQGWHKNKNGTRSRQWSVYCSACRGRKRRGLSGPAPPRPISDERYKTYKKDYCEKCSFVAEHPAQLDVDHVDGNGLNHDPSNLQTLCANCHRLKTMQAGDHLTPRTRRREAQQQAFVMYPCLIEH